MMKRVRVGVCGFFDDKGALGDGQTIRTLSVTNELELALGRESVKRVSYRDWKKRPLSLLFRLVMLECECKNLLLFPAQSAVNVLIPVTVTLKRLCGARVYYNVIGGWLPSHLTRNKWLVRYVKELDGLFVQTPRLKRDLAVLGIGKVHVFPNFKRVKMLAESEISLAQTKPLKACFFSRVKEKKGVAEMIEVVKEINSNGVKYTLDIYGQVSADYAGAFGEMQKHFPPFVRYMGVVDGWKASEVIKDYFIQLFPTKFPTEGFPGSILDSFSAGVPVLASRWDSCEDVIDDGVTGLTFDFNDFEDMKDKLERIYANPEVVTGMKIKCLERARMLEPQAVIKIMLDVMIGGAQ
jgi:glycosyltransferase involved in cell wall biosynthesis